VKIASIVDEQTRQRLGGLVGRLITSDRLADELDQIIVVCGAPAVSRCDYGPERTPRVLADRLKNRIGVAHIPRDKPWQDVRVESFNSRICRERLNLPSFSSLTHARVVIGA
jgi:hypothetical protein